MMTNCSRRPKRANELLLLSTAQVSADGTDADGLTAAEKYSLRPRSIAKRLEVEQKLKQERVQSQQPAQKRTPKPKQKPAPLSKYRRKTANARERSRMKEINQAFETLRRAIPQETLAYHSASPSPSSSSSSSSSCGSTSGGSEKWTKITTLRLAMDYIEALTRVLEHDTNFGGLIDSDFLMAGLDGLGGVGGAGSLMMMSGGTSGHHCPSLGSLDSSGESGISSGGGDHDLLSDDLDSFDDIPMSCVPDHCDVMASFDIFLESDGDSLHFHSELSDHTPNTP